ncbi:MAG: PQQ-dependent sugar dehydrogenase [Phycisphaerales bacterium]|nr:PQQ-dependent sugar dehydrogenase [Phycisphaerales bacterium]
MKRFCASALRRARGVIAIGCVAATASFADAQPIPYGDLRIDLAEVATGFAAAIQVTHANDGSGRLFVVDQIGKVWVVKNGAVLATPFLQISPPELVNVVGGYDERGLLGIAFHPDYANNGRVFVRYSKPRTGVSGEPCFGSSRGCHTEVLAEYHANPGADVVDGAAAKVILAIDKPQFNHNSGAIAFGPDGYLYMGMGDGGGAHDGLADNPPSHGPFGNGQNINTLMGKMLRLDVDTGSPYGIPADNPFVGVDGADEIFAYGFRNPFYFSFDDGPGGTGDLWLGEVGQNLYEEIDIVVKGGNYGWVIKEGFHCFNPFNPNIPPTNCDDAGMIDPIAEYDHTNGGIAILGGFVYRASQFPGLQGMYIFGDFSSNFTANTGHLFYIDTNHEHMTILRPRLHGTTEELGLTVKGTGRGGDGEIYICTGTTLGPSGSTGSIHVVTQCFADFDTSGFVDLDDYIAFVHAFELGGDDADFDGSGFVDLDDFIAFVHAFEAGC